MCSACQQLHSHARFTQHTRCALGSALPVCDLVAAMQKARRLTAPCKVASHVSSANAAQLTGSEAAPGATSSRPAAARSTWLLLHSRWWDERGWRGAGGGGRCRAPLAMSSRRRTAGVGQCQPWRQAQRRGRVWLRLLLDLVQPLTGQGWAWLDLSRRSPSGRDSHDEEADEGGGRGCAKTTPLPPALRMQSCGQVTSRCVKHGCAECG